MASIGLDLFEEDYNALSALISQSINTEEELANILEKFQNKLIDINFARYSQLDSLKAHAPEIIKYVFDMRMKVRDQLSTWHQKGLLSQQNENYVRAIFRISRYIVDMLGELHIDHDILESDETPYRAFCGPDINTLYHPSFGSGGGMPSFKSGDVLLVRGKLYNSAAIARIGDIDSQFSHASMVHIDESGKHWVVESVIEKGATITPLEEALDHGISRAILFRHTDINLAAQASHFIYNHVLKAQNGRSSKIYYDFSMELNGYDKLFCSKLVRFAFDKASEGQLKLPTYLTQLDSGSKDFLKRIGVKTAKTFAPGDLEIEPHFHLVAEWRDYRNTSDLRLQDLIMDKFFEWMEEHNYRFKETLTIKLIGVLGKLSSYLSKSAKELIDDILPQVPRNMSRKTIATIAMLHSTADEVFDKIQEIERQHIQTKGHAMHPSDILNHIEQYRVNAEDEVGYFSRMS